MTLAKQAERGGSLAPRVALWGVLLLVALAAPHVFTDLTARHLLVLIGINIMLVTALDLLLGYTGLISLGHGAFWGVGAYASALTVMRLDFPFPLALVTAAAAGGLAGLLLGIPALRLKGHHFAVVTFVGGIIITILMTNLVSLTRGPLGLPGIPFAEIRFFDFSHTFLTLRFKLGYYYLVLTFAILVLLLKQRIVNSRMGRALLAIKADENLAQSIGVNAYWYKVAIFTVSTAIAGLAGSLYAHYSAFISPDAFTFVQSFDLFVMNLVGGAGTFLGPIIGPALLTVLSNTLRNLSPILAQIAFGVLLILIITFLPQGVMGGIRQLGSRWRRS